MKSPRSTQRAIEITSTHAADQGVDDRAINQDEIEKINYSTKVIEQSAKMKLRKSITRPTCQLMVLAFFSCPIRLSNKAH